MFIYNFRIYKYFRSNRIPFKKISSLYLPFLKASLLGPEFFAKPLNALHAPKLDCPKVTSWLESPDSNFPDVPLTSLAENDSFDQYEIKSQASSVFRSASQANSILPQSVVSAREASIGRAPSHTESVVRSMVSSTSTVKLLDKKAEEFMSLEKYLEKNELKSKHVPYHVLQKVDIFDIVKTGKTRPENVPKEPGKCLIIIMNYSATLSKCLSQLIKFINL